MAFVPLATTTDLKTFRAMVRLKTGTVTIQESQLLDTSLDDIIHAAVVDVRTRLAQKLDEKYMTEAKSADGDIAEASNLIDVSTLGIADAGKITLYDSTNGPIPIKTPTEFDNIKTLYSATSLASAMFARLVNVKATDNKLQIETYRGTSVATPGALVLTYPRVPVKAAAATTKIDLPEDMIPLAEDVAVIMVSELLKKSPPADVVARVQETQGKPNA